MEKSRGIIVSMIDSLFLALIILPVIMFRIYEQPFGMAVLCALAIGLVGGAVWLGVNWLLRSRLTPRNH